jgi:hypothetical protein
MVTALNAFVEIGMFFVFIALIYCIVQIIDVIREERERLMWYRQIKAPVRTEDDQSDAP